MVGKVDFPFYKLVIRSLTILVIRTRLSPSAVIPAWAKPIYSPNLLKDKKP